MLARRLSSESQVRVAQDKGIFVPPNGQALKSRNLLEGSSPKKTAISHSIAQLKGMENRCLRKSRGLIHLREGSLDGISRVQAKMKYHRMAILEELPKVCQILVLRPDGHG
jgi:hypothetical protein